MKLILIVAATLTFMRSGIDIWVRTRVLSVLISGVLVHHNCGRELPSSLVLQPKEPNSWLSLHVELLARLEVTRSYSNGESLDLTDYLSPL